MCSNYEPVTLDDRLMAHFGVSRPSDVEPPESAFPGLKAFFIRAEDKAELAVAQAQLGFFGYLPEFAKDLAYGRKTYNCKSETMRDKAAFKVAWFSGNRCLIPIERGFEWCYETGDPVRWAVSRNNGEPLCAAGLWGVWIGPQGEEILSFTMLTVNADGHRIFSRFNPPGDEKRMPVFLRLEDQQEWLNCPIDKAGDFIRQFPADLLKAEPAPAPWKPLPEPKEWEIEPDMFAEEWREAADDPFARQAAARRKRPKVKAPPKEEDAGPTTGDLF
jgi:putative SOS response-associated peptidase YedK